MRWFRLGWLAVATMLALSFSGCGEEDVPIKRVPRPDAGDERECVDADGDGWGQYCELGVDCDDADPSITDECRRCRRRIEGCPCEPGSDWESCDPPDRRGDGGTFVCTEGTRYCRDGKWTECEVVGEYVFQPD
jgi:hypothetical protein